MEHLKEFLIRLQTFELRLIKKSIYKDIATNEKMEITAYDISHETQYYDSFSFKSQLRLMKDMALIDLIALDDRRINLEIKQIEKLKARFNKFWANYHDNYDGYHQSYNAGYPFSIRLDELFLVHNLQPDYADVCVDEKFVEDLSDSVKLRELFLKELLSETKKILEYDVDPTDMKPQVNTSQEPIIRKPSFIEGIRDNFYDILKNYFSEENQKLLYLLLQKNEQPETPLLFNGNGNQLADAFKQLIEANLIAGCNKAELEEWVADNFQYTFKNKQKSFSPGYLNGIISSDVKPCQSPIIDVKKQQDGTYTVVPAIRNKKINKNW